LFSKKEKFKMDIVWRESAPLDVYEEARIGRVFNHRRPARYPLAIVKAYNEEDIMKAVQLASKQKCRVSLRSGGHSWAAWSVRDDAVLVDLGKYDYIQVDPAARTACVSPSTTGRKLNNLLIAEYGLMFAAGHCPDVGLGGFLLQGGMGWNCRVYYSMTTFELNRHEKLTCLLYRIGAGHVNRLQVLTL
jgi:FAD/FMN-containing dehydrogenase